MDREEIRKGYVHCSHCDNVVSRSTFKRHERKRYLQDSKNDQAARSPDSEGENKVTIALTFKQFSNVCSSHTNKPWLPLKENRKNAHSFYFQNLSLKNPILSRNYHATIQTPQKIRMPHHQRVEVRKKYTSLINSEYTFLCETVEQK